MKQKVILAVMAIAMPFFVQAQDVETETTTQPETEVIEEELIDEGLEPEPELGLSITPTFGTIRSLEDNQDMLYYGDYAGADVAFEIRAEELKDFFIAKFELSTKFGYGKPQNEFYNATLMFGGEMPTFGSLFWLEFMVGFGYNWSVPYESKAIVGAKIGFGINFFEVINLSTRIVINTPLNLMRQGEGDFIMVESGITIRF